MLRSGLVLCALLLSACTSVDVDKDPVRGDYTITYTTDVFHSGASYRKTAAEKSGEADWTSMREILAEQESALKMDRSTPQADSLYHDAILKVNVKFHKAVAAATRNPLAIMVLQAISEPLVKVSRRTNEMPGVPEAGLRQHWAIYRAVRENNPEKARHAMRLHLQAAERNAHILEQKDELAEPASVRAVTSAHKPQDSL